MKKEEVEKYFLLERERQEIRKKLTEIEGQERDKTSEIDSYLAYLAAEQAKHHGIETGRRYAVGEKRYEIRGIHGAISIEGGEAKLVIWVAAHKIFRGDRIEKSVTLFNISKTTFTPI